MWHEISAHSIRTLGTKDYEKARPVRLRPEEIVEQDNYEARLLVQNFKAKYVPFVAIDLLCRVREIAESGINGQLLLDTNIIRKDGTLLEDPPLPLFMDTEGFIIRNVNEEFVESGYFLTVDEIQLAIIGIAAAQKAVQPKPNS